jgi:hypothetical protein
MMLVMSMMWAPSYGEKRSGMVRRWGGRGVQHWSQWGRSGVNRGDHFFGKEQIGGGVDRRFQPGEEEMEQVQKPTGAPIMYVFNHIDG